MTAWKFYDGKETNVSEPVVLPIGSYIQSPNFKSIMFNNYPAVGGIPEKKPPEPVVEIATIPQEEISLPEWFVFPPLACPRYTQKYWWKHRAVDLVTTCRSNTIAIADDGIVIFAGWQDGYGNRVEIDHRNGFITTYSHLSEIWVEKGQEVEMRMSVGVLGSTGFSTGIHLHYEIIYQGQKIDPEKYL